MKDSEYDTSTKMNPPLRCDDDRVAVIDGLRDGTIDCIATDHAPHCQAEKELEFANAPYGMIGFETAISMIVMELIGKQKMSWFDVISKLTVNPAEIIREKTGRISPGEVANITVIAPNKKWTVTEDGIRSRSKNTPFLGKEIKGRVTNVIVRGSVKYSLKE